MDHYSCIIIGQDVSTFTDIIQYEEGCPGNIFNMGFKRRPDQKLILIRTGGQINAIQKI